MSTPTNTQNNFDGIHVSKGFVRGLQGQVLKLEQNQQSLIRQLEHANKLASEYHATAVAWQHKHGIALHEMEKTKQAFDHERMQWTSSLNQVVELYEREKKLRLDREHEMTHLEQLLAEQIEMSPSPTHHPHRKREDSLPPHEPMSPVSVSSSSSPRTPMCDLPRMKNVTSTQSARNCEEYIQKQLLIEADTAIPFDENGERIIMRDGKKIKQSVCYGFGGMPWYDEKEMTTSEDEDSEDSALNEFYGNYYPNDAYSSQTTDCSGDPICHSDSD